MGSVYRMDTTSLDTLQQHSYNDRLPGEGMILTMIGYQMWEFTQLCLVHFLTTQCIAKDSNNAVGPGSLMENIACNSYKAFFKILNYFLAQNDKT
jgi:hypothetical protein